MIGRGRFDAADGVADGGEVDDVAGLDEGGRGAVFIPHRGVGRADQLPAAGALPRVDAAERAGQSDRAGGHLEARVGATGYVEDGVAAGQIGESWRESAECRAPRMPGMAGDDLLRRHAQQIRNRLQILAVVHDRNGHVFRRPFH